MYIDIHIHVTVLSFKYMMNVSRAALTHTCCCSVLQEVKLCSPDYKDTEADAAIKDFQERIKNYELAYETLDNKKDK